MGMVTEFVLILTGTDANLVLLFTVLHVFRDVKSGYILHTLSVWSLTMCMSF